MWAHYADQGRGYALCFSQVSTKMAGKISHLSGHPNLIPEKVEYTSEADILTLRDVLGISICQGENPKLTLICELLDFQEILRLMRQQTGSKVRKCFQLRSHVSIITSRALHLHLR